jgi:hypothetical protein
VVYLYFDSLRLWWARVRGVPAMAGAETI